mmetsp:Transcript_51907/g.92621  ORF Transcript_51907/g.92621 Transcript_51907/m.92621 type:complete len:93 (+) Transcript_51907:432-710(+)
MVRVDSGWQLGIGDWDEVQVRHEARDGLQVALSLDQAVGPWTGVSALTQTENVTGRGATAEEGSQPVERQLQEIGDSLGCWPVRVKAPSAVR